MSSRRTADRALAVGVARDPPVDPVSDDGEDEGEEESMFDIDEARAYANECRAHAAEALVKTKALFEYFSRTGRLRADYTILLGATESIYRVAIIVDLALIVQAYEDIWYDLDDWKERIDRLVAAVAAVNTNTAADIERTAPSRTGALAAMAPDVDWILANVDGPEGGHLWLEDLEPGELRVREAFLGERAAEAQ